MDHEAALTGDTGAVARLTDVEAATRLATELAASADVRTVAVHTDPDDPAWALVRATGEVGAIAETMASAPGAAVSPTRSRRLRRHRVRWERGRPTPGVSMVFDVRRNAGLSSDDFHRHWRDIHGPKALAHHLGMWDYDQVSLVGGDIDLDGIAVVGFASAEDATHRFFDGPEGAAIIRADAASFTDADTLGRRLTTELVVKDDETSPFHEGHRQDLADHRSLELGAPPDEVWRLLGDFGAILDWWPHGLSTIQLDEGPPVVRALGRPDGSSVTEVLVHHRPDERMFQLAITAGFPDSVADYTCRYEIRASAAGCRLDWSPRASVAAGSESTFHGIVDSGWEQITTGLTARFGA